MIHPFQVTWAELDGVVPDIFRTKHMTEAMTEAIRQQDYPVVIQSKLVTINVLCKIDRHYPPRDLIKLRERLEVVIQQLTPKKPFDEDALYLKLMHAVHSSQKAGMGEL